MIRSGLSSTLNTAISLKISFWSCNLTTWGLSCTFILYVGMLMLPLPVVPQCTLNHHFFQKSVVTSPGSKKCSQSQFFTIPNVDFYGGPPIAAPRGTINNNGTNLKPSLSVISGMCSPPFMNVKNLHYFNF